MTMYIDTTDPRFSISSDELNWLQVYNSVFTDIAEEIDPLFDIPTIPSPRPVSANDSFELLRSQHFPRPHSLDQRYPLPSSRQAFAVQATPSTSSAITPAVNVSTPPSISATGSSTQWIYRSPNQPSSRLRPARSSSPPSDGPAQSSAEKSSSAGKGPLLSLLRPQSRQRTDSMLVKVPPSPPASTTARSKLSISTLLVPPTSHVRVTSLASTESSVSTAPSCSPPHTPTTPDIAPVHPHDLCSDIPVFDSISLDIRSIDLEAEVDGRRNSLSSMSSARVGRSSLKASSLRSGGRRGMQKHSLGTIASTKSVKFVEEPTIHYASQGYWDFEAMEEENEEKAGYDWSEQRQQQWNSGTLADVIEVEEALEPPSEGKLRGRSRKVIGLFGRQDSLKRLRTIRTPTPVSNLRKQASPAPAKRDPPKPKPKPTQRRKSSDGPRPIISGPLPLGSAPRPHTSSTSIDISLLEGRPHERRNSNESLNSTQSAGSRSIRSFRSNLSTGSRSIRDWMRDRSGT